MTECPTCKRPIIEGEAQCPQCGVIFAKWRDPKLRAAEARLEAFGKEAASGFPRSIIIGLILAVALPLVVVFVPDVSVPLLGAKLRYHLKKDSSFMHQASAAVLVTMPTVGRVPTIVDQLELKIDTHLRVMETDTGGNVTLRKNADRVALFSALANPTEMQKTSDALSSWSTSWIMNPHGGPITTMVAVANQMRANAQAFQQQAKLRDDRAANYYGKDAASGGPVVAVDPYQKIFDALRYSDATYLDRSTAFEYPRERVRTGFSWELPIHTTLRSKWFGAEISQPVTYTIKEFRRDAAGFMMVLEWNTKLTPHLVQTSDLSWPFLSDAILGGDYRGKAWINYGDGVVQKWEGEYDLTLNPTLSNTPALLQILGLLGAPGSAAQVSPLELKVSEKIVRL